MLQPNGVQAGTIAEDPLGVFVKPVLAWLDETKVPGAPVQDARRSAPRGKNGLKNEASALWSVEDTRRRSEELADTS